MNISESNTIYLIQPQSLFKIFWWNQLGTNDPFKVFDYIVLMDPLVVKMGIVINNTRVFPIERFFNPESVRIKWTKYSRDYLIKSNEPELKIIFGNKKTTFDKVLNQKEYKQYLEHVGMNNTVVYEIEHADSYFIGSEIDNDNGIVFTPYEYEDMNNPDVDVDVTLEELF